MLKIKTAQDFTDVDVKRVWGSIVEEREQCKQKLQVIAQVEQELESVLASDPHMSLRGDPSHQLPGLDTDYPDLWNKIQAILGEHGSLNPNKGILGGQG